MKPISITLEQANQIWDILVEHAGAHESFRQDFLSQRDNLTEYRFQGKLGFGGKFRNQPYSPIWRVTCYSEDETPARTKIIETTNQKLNELLRTSTSDQG